MRTLIIGCGGIGSFLSEYLNTLIINDVQGTENLDITVVDDDIVEEKNVRYQNFPNPEDLKNPKAQVIGERYLFNYKIKRITSDDDLKDYNLIVLAVDNGKVRKLVYEYCDKNKDVKFIDLRSEGTAVAFYTTHKDNTLDKMLNTIDPDAPSTSCQLAFELAEGKIQQGNKIIASIGSQLILNELRGEPNLAQFNFRF